MPITYLDVPEGIRIEPKKQLVKAIFEALHEAYPFPDDVRIFLREWPLDSVSHDGQLGSEPVRPVFMMHIPQGANINAKRKMLRKINDAVVEAYHLPKFVIFMQEYPLTVWRSMAAFIPTTRRVSRPRRRSIATNQKSNNECP
jgi:phenylpyruvate tautomerase PptA (4-oxalocrotonate tautomerase family)